MIDIIQLRTRRFSALYALLTGGISTEPPVHFSVPAHLLRDVGLLGSVGQKQFVSHMGVHLRLSGL